MEIEKLQSAIEAILFTMGDSVELEKLASAIGHDEETTRKLIRNMMDKYEADDRGIRIIELDHAYQLCTKKEMYELAMDFKAADKEYIVNVYNRMDAVLDHGKGSVLYDVNGKEYIDLSAGIAVNVFGVCDDVWKDAVTAQLNKHEGTNMECALGEISCMERMKEVVTNIRNIRAQRNISPKQALELLIMGNDDTIVSHKAAVMKLANISEVGTPSEKPENAASFLVGTTEYFILLLDLIDTEEELKKLEADLEYQEGFLQSVLKKLGNEKFVNNAPAKVVEMERKKQADAESKIAALKDSIAKLK